MITPTVDIPPHLQMSAGGYMELRLTTCQIADTRDLEILIELFDCTFLSRSCDSREVMAEIQWWLGTSLLRCLALRDVFEIRHLDFNPFLYRSNRQ